MTRPLEDPRDMHAERDRDDRYDLAPDTLDDDIERSAEVERYRRTEAEL